MASEQPEPALWDFARFVDGQVLGTHRMCLDESRLRLWSEIFEMPGNEGALSGSLLVNAMMEAYLSVAQPRPPGNIHAGQKITSYGRPPKLGETLSVTIAVGGKSERKNRNWLAFNSTIRAGDEVLLEGEILTIWAK
jgi:hypothetical protein